MMVKTQVQIPDALYREAKRIATEAEMSFAEVVRRGLEEMVKRYPAGRMSVAEWKPPTPLDLGEPLAPESMWTTLSHD